MQKNYSPNPCGRKNPFLHTRCSSVSTNKIIPQQFHSDYSSSEVESFSYSFAQILQRYIPSYTLPFSKNLLSAILSTLPKTLDNFSLQISAEILEKHSKKEEVYQKTSRNLLKYEELLKDKAQALEERIKNWQKAVDSESNRIETEKNELVKAKVKAESELNSALAVLKEKETQILAQISEISLLQTQLHSEKLQAEELKWKLEQYVNEISEKESILELKDQMLMMEKEEFIAEKSNVESQKMINEMLATEYIRNSKNQFFSKRPGSSYAGDINHSINYESSPVKSRSQSRSEYKIDTSLTIDKITFINFINSKNSLERSVAELKDLKVKILPELNQSSEELGILIEELKKKKEKIEEVLESFNEKFKKLQEKEEKIDEIFKEFEEFRVKLDAREKQLEEKEKNIDEREKRIELDMEAFSKEKMEFLEDMHEERKRIEEYYVGIEAKVQVLDLKSTELKEAKRLLNSKEINKY